MLSYQQYKEERAELENLNADIPSLADTKPSRLRIKKLAPARCLMYKELAELPTTRPEEPLPMFRSAGKKPRIRAKKARARYGPRSKKKKVR